MSTEAAQAATAANGGIPLDLAEWSYFFVGVERAELARGARIVNGKQMYVESFIPAQVRHPYPIVLVHGGGGQGTRLDGHAGRAPRLGADPARGRLQGLCRRSAGPRTLAAIIPTSTAVPRAGDIRSKASRDGSRRRTAAAPDNGRYRKLHNQWPGTGELGSKDLDQFVASQGGSYVSAPAGRRAGGAVPAGAPAERPQAGGRRRRRGRRGGRRQAAGGTRGRAGAAPAPLPGAARPRLDGRRRPADRIRQHLVWRQRGAMLLDKIGPAIIMTHSAGGPFGWLVAEIRPNLVKGIIAIEGGGQPFGGQNVWGMSTIPVAYDPPVSDPSEIKTKRVDAAGAGRQRVPAAGRAGAQTEEPAEHSDRDRHGGSVVRVARQSRRGRRTSSRRACKAEELRLVNLGIHGNGHMMMVEKNNREVLKPILAWVDKNVNGSAKRRARRRAAKKDSTAMKLADMGYFWVGAEEKKMPYGTILSRADVRAVPDAGAGAPSVSGRARARRRRVDAALHGRRRAVGLGALLRAGRLSRLPRRSSRPRPRAVPSRRARPDRPAT